MQSMNESPMADMAGQQEGIMKGSIRAGLGFLTFILVMGYLIGISDKLDLIVTNLQRKEKLMQSMNESPMADMAGQQEGEPQEIGGVTGQRLKAYLERIERLETEKSELAEDIKEVYGEAKSNGFDTKTMRKLVRLRKMDNQKRNEEEELLELYKAAIGLE